MIDAPNKAVFLSYASQDAEAARNICEALRSGGVEVWFDADGGLEHGDEWDAKIRKQIKECVLFIPVISANTQARHEGYFRIEWDLAAERARGIASGIPFILPVVIDDTREPDALVPDRFRMVQWTKLPGGVVPPEVKARYLKLWSQRTSAPSRESRPGDTPTRAMTRTAFTGSRGLAAILFTDVVGYSARMQRDEHATLAQVEADFALMRERCTEHEGEVLNSMGDGLLMCFPSAVQAVTCALLIQEEFGRRRATLPPEQALEHRMGVHIGDVIRQESGGVAGDGVNIAARLEAKAPAGGVCVSQIVHDTVQGKVPMQAVFVGEESFKNIAKPIPVWHLAPAGSPAPARPSGAATKRPEPRGIRRWVFAIVGLAVLGGLAVFLFSRPGNRAATPAENSLAPAAATFPRQPDLKRARTLIYTLDSIAGDFALADDLVKPLLAAQPNDPEVVTVAAEVAVEYLARGYDQTQARRAAAQRLAERAVQLAPDNPAALAALGGYLRSARIQLGRAEEVLRRAIALDPQEPRYYRRLYSVLLVAKPGPETEAFGADMAARFPRDPQVAAELTSLPLSTGDLAAAEAAVDRTLALAPVANAITWKAKLRLEVHGDVAGMKLWLDRMPERQRTHARLASAYVVAALVTGQTGPARKLLDGITDPWLADATYIFPKAMLLGDLDAIDGNTDIARTFYEAALEEIRRALAADPTDLRPKRAELWVQLALGHRAEALAALRINLQRRPNPYRWTIGLTWWTSSLRACLLLDERAEAMVQLREACAEAQGRLLLRNLFKVDPKMAPFRHDPEIAALLAEPKGGLATTATPPDDRSIAVLAFLNQSADKENEFFSDGIADELLGTLQKIPGLKVAARMSAWSFKGKNATTQEIGEKLGVAHVVEGSVQKAGNRVKISARLSRAATGEQVWSENFTRDLADVFAVQTEIAQAIVAQVRGQLTGEEAAQAKTEIQAQVRAAQRGGTTNAAAHEEYLQGRYFQIHDLVGNLARPVARFHRAVELDPKFALGWAALAHAHAWQASLAPTVAEIGEGFAQARRAADRALELEPNLPEGHAARMLIQLNHDFDWQGARKSLQQARALAPLNPTMLVFALELDGIFGQTDPDAAIAQVRQALTLDPMNVGLANLLANCYQGAGRFGEAEAEWKRLIELAPQGSHGSLADLYASRGRYAEAVAEAEKESVEWVRLNALATAQWGLKNVAAADAALRQLIAKYGEQCGIQIAVIYGLREELDQTFAWLDRAYLQRDSGLPGIKGWQRNANLRRVCADPRWPAFLRKLGMADDQLK